MDITRETLITIPEAARQVPPKGVHVATCWRWSLNGLADGRKLETARLGGRVYTSVEALGRFLQPATPAKPTTSQRSQQIDAAEQELAAYGI